MIFIVEALALGESNQAVKLMVLRDEEPTANEQADLASRASGQFRVQYGDWCSEVPKVTVTRRG
jgi:hypothetical protein